MRRRGARRGDAQVAELDHRGEAQARRGRARRHVPADDARRRRRHELQGTLQLEDPPAAGRGEGAARAPAAPEGERRPPPPPDGDVPRPPQAPTLQARDAGAQATAARRAGWRRRRAPTPTCGRRGRRARRSAPLAETFIVRLHGWRRCQLRVLGARRRARAPIVGPADWRRDRHRRLDRRRSPSRRINLVSLADPLLAEIAKYVGTPGVGKLAQHGAAMRVAFFANLGAKTTFFASSNGSTTAPTRQRDVPAIGALKEGRRVTPDLLPAGPACSRSCGSLGSTTAR